MFFNLYKSLTGMRNKTTFAQHSTAQHSTAQHSTAQHSTAQHSTAQHSTADTAQHSTAQHSTAQHSTAQHSTADILFCIIKYWTDNYANPDGHLVFIRVGFFCLPDGIEVRHV